MARDPDLQINRLRRMAERARLHRIRAIEARNNRMQTRARCLEALVESRLGPLVDGRVKRYGDFA